VATLADAARRGAARLAAAGWTSDDSSRDADVLARALLQWDAAAWLSRRREDAPAPFVTAFDAAVARRLRHEPIAYITGVREFYGRPFRVTPAVLIPRPETEGVIDEVRALLADRPTGARVADVGTGSGCLAITLALEHPGVDMVATDISRDALDVARANAAALGAPVRFVDTSLLDGLAGPLDLIVSNPPYVAARDRESLPPDVRQFEPAAALFGGQDGLEVIRALVQAAALTLGDHGWLVMEIGAGQARSVEAIAAAAGLSVVRLAPDLAGIPRVVVATRSTGR
jgi:release factor glutamine methyltransferase